MHRRAGADRSDRGASDPGRDSPREPAGRLPTGARTCVTELPVPRPARTSPSTSAGPRPACRGPTRSCRSGATGWSSRTSTATSSSTSRPASPSTRPATATPRSCAAIKRQAADLIHFCASDFYLPIYPEAAEQLARIAPFDGPARVYLGNSGTEVVEAAIKLARYATRRQYVVAFLGAFHGRTYGSVSLTASKAKYHAGFGPLLPGVFHAPYGKVDDLRWFDEVLFKQARAGQRGRRDLRRADPGRGRLRRPRGRLPARPARHLRSRTASCWSPTRSSRAPAGPAGCGPSSTGASSPTSCCRPRASPPACPSAR